MAAQGLTKPPFPLSCSSLQRSGVASVAGFWNVVPDAATTICRKLGHMGYQPGCQLSFVTSALLFLINNFSNKHLPDASLTS